MNTRGKIATCLWFDGDGEAAAQFYTALIADSRITNLFRPQPDGPPLLVEFTLAGVPYQALNGGPYFRHSEAASIVVHTDSAEETDRLWQALLADGGSESQCGWLKDRFGLSWQVLLQGNIDVFSVKQDVLRKAQWRWHGGAMSSQCNAAEGVLPSALRVSPKAASCGVACS